MPVTIYALSFDHPHTARAAEKKRIEVIVMVSEIAMPYAPASFAEVPKVITSRMQQTARM